jgi:hypothetical protein
LSVDDVQINFGDTSQADQEIGQSNCSFIPAWRYVRIYIDLQRLPQASRVYDVRPIPL